MKEIWKDIPGFENRYLASSKGRIKSLITNRFLKLMPTPSKYLYVALRKNKKTYRLCVHRLIAFTFIGYGTSKQEIGHLDGNNQNNNVENLIWVTRKENMQHMILHGRTIRGERHPFVKITLEQVKKIKKLLKEKVPVKDIYKIVKVKKYHVDNIKFQNQWSWVNI